MKRKEFVTGIRRGIPICVGYFSVSFGFGAMVVAQGLGVLHAVVISASNLTSAGQFAGLTVITAGASLIEMVLTQLVINSRYALMSLALGPRLGPSVGVGKRLLVAFFNTDEVFALGMSRTEPLTPSYFVGIGTISALGWVAGTALGAFAGSLLPETVRISMSVLLYGMFIAIVAPQARKEKPMLVCVVLALVLSCLFTWVPGIRQLSAGLVIVVCTVVAAAICAWVFPVKQEVGQ